MRKIGVVVLVIAAMVAACPAFAGNVLVNGNFEVGSTPTVGNSSPWVLGSGLALGKADVAHDWAVFCKDPSGNLQLSQQPIDASLNNPDWNAAGAFETLSLTADIRDVWPLGDPNHPTSDIKFRLDWFNPANAQELFSAYQTFTFTGDNVWQTIHPFTDFVPTLNGLPGGVPFQPRFLSVEVLIDQAPGETVWVDNLVLDAKCHTAVPEPMSIVLGMMGLSSMVGLRRVFGKKTA